MRGLVVRPMGANAIVTVERSRQIVFRGDAFTAKHTEFKVGLRLDYSSGVLIRNSTLLALRRPHPEVVDLPASRGGRRTSTVVQRLVPRLPRLRLHRRPDGPNLGDPREPLRPRAGVPHGLGRSAPPGPDRALQRRRPSRHQERRSASARAAGRSSNLATADDGVRVIDNLFLRDDPLAPGARRPGRDPGRDACEPRIPRGTEIVNNTILSGRRRAGTRESLDRAQPALFGACSDATAP